MRVTLFVRCDAALGRELATDVLEKGKPLTEFAE